MASLKFEGSLEGISDKQQKFIREVLEKLGFITNKVIFEPAAKAGDNYVANVVRITVVVEGGNDLKIIGKIATSNEVLRNMMNTELLFNNEIIIYEQVLPKINSLQKEAGVPENERLKYAKCYGCQSEQPNEVILLEDLKPHDYVMLDRLEPMNNDAVLLVLKNFGNLHAMSYVLKHLEPETYDNLKTDLIEMRAVIMNKKEQIAFVELIEKSALEVLDDENYKVAIRGIVSKTYTFSEKIKKHENPKHLVIQQGDTWTNNILFKLNGDKPVDAIMIDYQLASESSPVADLLYFIFNSTDYSSRSKYYYEWISYYHDQLNNMLEYFGLKASLIYPREQLDADLRRYSQLFFGTAVMLLSILSRSTEEAAEMHDAVSNYDEEKLLGLQVQSLSQGTVLKYKLRIQELIDSYRELGYIR